MSISFKSIKLLLDFKAKEFFVCLFFQLPSCYFSLFPKLVSSVLIFKWIWYLLQLFDHLFFFILLVVLLLKKSCLIGRAKAPFFVTSIHSNGPFVIFCPGNVLFCTLEGQMVQVLQLLCSSALGLLARGHSHVSLELCVSPVEMRLCHKTGT